MNYYRLIRVFLTILAFSILIISSVSAKQVRISVWNIPEFKMFHGVREAIHEFERRTGIIVDMGASGNLEDQQKLMTAIAAKTPPDLLWQDSLR